MGNGIPEKSAVQRSYAKFREIDKDIISYNRRKCISFDTTFLLDLQEKLT